MLNTAMRNAVSPFQKPRQMRSRKFPFFWSVIGLLPGIELSFFESSSMRVKTESIPYQTRRTIVPINAALRFRILSHNDNPGKGRKSGRSVHGSVDPVVSRAPDRRMKRPPSRTAATVRPAMSPTHIPAAPQPRSNVSQ